MIILYTFYSIICYVIIIFNKVILELFFDNSTRKLINIFFQCKLTYLTRLFKRFVARPFTDVKYAWTAALNMLKVFLTK